MLANICGNKNFMSNNHRYSYLKIISKNTIMKSLSFVSALAFWILSTCFLPTSAQAKPLSVGDTAPDIYLPDPNNTTISLASLRGDIVLLYFWASWEPNTEFIAPNLAILHDKYHQAQFSGAKGFSIYTVSLDSDQQEWRNALRHYQMPGSNHVSDFYSTYSSAYGLSKLPTYYLIDERGIIVGVDMSMGELDRALAQRATLSSSAPAPRPSTMSNNSGGWQTVSNTTTYSSSSGMPSYTSSGQTPGNNNWVPVKDATTTAATTRANERGNASVRTYHPTQPATYTTDNNGEWVEVKSPVRNQRGNASAVTWQSPETLPHNPAADHNTTKPAEMNQTTEATTTAEKSANNIPINTQATTKGSHYKIQLGAYKYLNSSDFDKVASLGTLTAEQATTDIQRVMLGDYTDKINAVKTLATLRDAGYTDAYIMIYDSEKRIKPLSKEETSAIAQKHQIKLAVVTEAPAKPIEMSLMADNTTTTTKVTTLADPKITDNRPIAVAKTTSTAKADKDKTIPTVANTAMDKKTTSIETYSVAPMPSEVIYTPPVSIGQNTHYDHQVVSGNSSITTYRYEPTGQHTTTGSQVATYTTDPNVGQLSYGTISEAYSTPRQQNWDRTYYDNQQTRYTSAPTTYNTTNSHVQTSGNGVWVPIDIPVFSQTTATTSTNTRSGSTTTTSPQNSNIQFDWYPEANSPRYTSNSTATTTTRTTTTNTPTTTQRSSTAAPYTPASDRARAAQNLADTYSAPTNNTNTGNKANSSSSTTSTNAANDNKSATPANNATTKTNDNNAELDQYIDKYLNDYEYSANKSKRLKAKDKRQKKDKK